VYWINLCFWSARDTWNMPAPSGRLPASRRFTKILSLSLSLSSIFSPRAGPGLLLCGGGPAGDRHGKAEGGRTSVLLYECLQADDQARMQKSGCADKPRFMFLSQAHCASIMPAMLRAAAQISEFLISSSHRGPSIPSRLLFPAVGSPKPHGMRSLGSPRPPLACPGEEQRQDRQDT